MREERVLCDGCGNDLTMRSRSSPYRLALVLDFKQADPEADNLPLAEYVPLIDRDHHFCCLDCVDRWRNSVKAKP